jgi:hypothetical protein
MPSSPGSSLDCPSDLPSNEEKEPRGSGSAPRLSSIVPTIVVRRPSALGVRINRYAPHMREVPFYPACGLKIALDGRAMRKLKSMAPTMKVVLLIVGSKYPVTTL